MNDLLKQAVSLSLLGKCIAAAVGILVIHAVFRVLEQTLPRRFGPADARYRARKFVVFAGYLSRLCFSSPSSLKIAWAASASRSVLSVREWQSRCRTSWQALRAHSPSAFRGCTPWETEFRSATREVT
jgi:hypothetical protein